MADIGTAAETTCKLSPTTTDPEQTLTTAKLCTTATIKSATHQSFGHTHTLQLADNSVTASGLPSSTKAKDSCPTQLGKSSPIDHNGTSTSTFKSVSHKQDVSILVRDSTAQKLNSFRFSSQRKRSSITENSSSPDPPKRMSLGNDNDVCMSVTKKKTVTPADDVLRSEASMEMFDSFEDSMHVDTSSNGMQDPISEQVQSGFTTLSSSLTTPTRSMYGSKPQRHLVTPTSSFSTPTKPPTHRTSIASIARAARQSSGKQSTPLHIHDPTSNISTTDRFPANNYQRALGDLRPSSDNATHRGHVSGDCTPLGRQSASDGSRGGEFSTPLNRHTPLGAGYSTPQPTPLVCTPSKEPDSCGVEILRTPVALVKRKFPGPAGLLPPLV